MTLAVVTGVAGFIGSHLAEALLQQGDSVIGIDNFNDYYDTRFKRHNVKALQEYPHFKLLETSIEDLDWTELLVGVEFIYHQAAQAGVRGSWGKSFPYYTQRNINATQVILEAAKDADSLIRFIYASTSSIYGNAETFPTDENIPPQPISPYGITKLAAERLCWLYWQNFAIPVVSLRYFSVYGPRQRPDMAFHKFFKAAITNESISIYGDGQQTRDFTYVKDIVTANLLAAHHQAAIGEIFNIGGGSRLFLSEVISEIEIIIGKPLQKTYVEKARGDARHTTADISKAQNILGYSPQFSLQKGLTAQWEYTLNMY